jgi:chemotaxis protein MotB
LARKRNAGGAGGGGHDGGGGMRWLLTYADLITLLMVFFVVMYAMSNVDKKKYETVSASLRQALHIEGSANSLIADRMGQLQMEAIRPTDQMDLKDVQIQEDAEFKKVVELIKNNSTAEEQRSVKFNIDERGLVISFLDTLLFDVGHADIRPEAYPVLDRLAAAVKDSPRTIRVEGHTDNLPIATIQYPSNWELSAARAIMVTRYFITKHGIDPHRLSATGYGEYRPVVANNGEEDRRKNRRVDIVVLRSTVNVLETK